MNGQPQPGLFIGIDWADQKHDCYVIDRDGKGFHQKFKQSPEDIDTWVAEMLNLADGKPIAIMLEQSRGPLVHAVMFRENVLLFPINPKQFARYRESYPGGGKDDPTDALYLARMLCERKSHQTQVVLTKDLRRRLRAFALGFAPATPIWSKSQPSCGAG